MIVAYHVIMGMYGFWLPNDPRGSWSDFVGSWDLFRYGQATKTNLRRSLARGPHDATRRRAAKQALKYPPVILTGRQARAVGRGFSRYFSRSGAVAWACAILPDHVHLVVSRLRYPVEQLMIQAKGAATRALVDECLHPMEHWRDANGNLPKCFARGGWTVFLDADAVGRAIRYVEENPVKAGKKR